MTTWESSACVLAVFALGLCGLAEAGASRVEVGPRGGLRVDGKPFFPIYAWAVPQGHITFNKNLGLNAVCNDPQKGRMISMMDEVHAAGMMSMVGAGAYSPAVAEHPALLCWRFGDEPDMKDIMPDKLVARYRALRAKDATHPIWINLTVRFYSKYHEGYVKRKKCPDLATYRRYGEACQLISFDHYPVTGWNKPDRVPELYYSTAEFQKLYPRNLIMVIVESADQDLSWTPKNTRGPTPEETRAEVWMSIVGGARGIGYFHVAFNPFRYQNLTPGMKKELPRLNGQITKLAPPPSWKAKW